MDILERINLFLWDNILIYLLLFTGLVCTIRTGFIQLRLFPFLLSRKNSKNKGISQFKTFSMSLGTAMGTGNITGVAAALSVGGAGSVFWMWVSAFLGMALVYAENSLSAKYSAKKCRGAVAYLKYGINSPMTALFFAVMCICVSFGMGGMVQINSFCESLAECTEYNRLIMFIIAFAIIVIVTGGGVRRISGVAQFILPFASILYFSACIIVIISNSEHLLSAVSEIFTDAFGIKQLVGGTAGYTVSKAVSTGIRRGIFSNEAGLGSSSILHSASESDDSYAQGMWGVTEVFIDTMVCCTLTALTLLCSGSTVNITECFSSVLGRYSSCFITTELGIFAFCTVIGWYYCGECAYIYLSDGFGKKFFTLVFSFIASLGAVVSVKTVWTVSDIFNGLMALPNVICLLILSKELRIYSNKNAGIKCCKKTFHKH